MSVAFRSRSNFFTTTYTIKTIKTCYHRAAAAAVVVVVVVVVLESDLNNAAFLKFVINGDWSDGLAG